jgi:hypothetical protein
MVENLKILACFHMELCEPVAAKESYKIQMWMRLEPWALLKPSKRKKSRIGYFWTSQWPCENSTFLSVVHRDSRAADAGKSTSLAIFCWFKPSFTKFFLNFWKILF